MIKWILLVLQKQVYRGRPCSAYMPNEEVVQCHKNGYPFIPGKQVVYILDCGDHLIIWELT